MGGEVGIVSLRLSQCIFLLLVSTNTSPRFNCLSEKLNLNRPRSTVHLRCSVASWRAVWSSCISHHALLVGLHFLDHICHGWRENERAEREKEERALWALQRDICCYTGNSLACKGCVLVSVVCFWSLGSEWEGKLCICYISEWPWSSDPQVSTLRPAAVWEQRAESRTNVAQEKKINWERERERERERDGRKAGEIGVMVHFSHFCVGWLAAYHVTVLGIIDNMKDLWHMVTIQLPKPVYEYGTSMKGCRIHNKYWGNIVSETV